MFYKTVLWINIVRNTLLLHVPYSYGKINILTVLFFNQKNLFLLATSVLNLKSTSTNRMRKVMTRVENEIAKAERVISGDGAPDQIGDESGRPNEEAIPHQMTITTFFPRSCVQRSCERSRS